MASTVLLNRSESVKHFDHAYMAMYQLEQYENISLDTESEIKASTVCHMQYQQVQTLKYNNNQWQITLNLPALTGSLGSLPLYDQALVIQGEQAYKQAVASFFDIFHKGLFILGYHSWLQNRLLGEYHHRKTISTLSVYTSPLKQHHFLSALTGRAGNQTNVDDFLVGQSMALSRKNISSSTLQALLQSYFKLPIAVKNFYQKSCATKIADQAKLSATAVCQLGDNSLLGATFSMYQNQLLLEIGPLDYQQYLSFLPGGQLLASFKELVKKILPGHFAINALLILKKEQIPLLQLQKPFNQLGRNAWLYAEEYSNDIKACVVNIQ